MPLFASGLPQDRHNRPVSYGPNVFLLNLLSKREGRDLINQKGKQGWIEETRLINKIIIMSLLDV